MTPAAEPARRIWRADPGLRHGLDPDRDGWSVPWWAAGSTACRAVSGALCDLRPAGLSTGIACGGRGRGGPGAIVV